MTWFSNLIKTLAYLSHSEYFIEEKVKENKKIDKSSLNTSYLSNEKQTWRFSSKMHNTSFETASLSFSNT